MLNICSCVREPYRKVQLIRLEHVQVERIESVLTLAAICFPYFLDLYRVSTFFVLQDLSVF